MPSFSKLSSLSEVPPPAEHQRADCRYSLSRIARFSAEQCHAQLWPKNATRLSGKSGLAPRGNRACGHRRHRAGAANPEWRAIGLTAGLCSSALFALVQLLRPAPTALRSNRFAQDSPLEEAGFEPSVPRQRIIIFQGCPARTMAGWGLPDEHHAR